MTTLNATRRNGGTPYTQALARRPGRPAGQAVDPERADAELRRRRMVGQRIREARQRLGLSQTRLALQLDMRDYQSLSQWENGRTSPGALNLERLAAAVGESVHYFYGGASAHPLPVEQDPDPYAQPVPDPADALRAIGELLEVLDRVSGLLDRLGRAGAMIDVRLDALRALGFAPGFSLAHTRTER